MKTSLLILSLLFLQIFSFGQNGKTDSNSSSDDFSKTKRTIHYEGEVLKYFDFSEGLPEGWTLIDSSGIGGFIFIDADTTHAGAFTDANSGLIPNSGSEGGMMHLPVDFYNCNSDVYPIEAVEEFVDIDAAMETDWIDISNATSGLVLQFSTWFKLCCNDSVTKLDINISTDGTNWTTLNGRLINGIQTFDNILPTSDVWKANISSIVEGSSQIKIQFRMHGGTHYFWTIDDVKLLVPLANDLSIGDAILNCNGVQTESAGAYTYANLNSNYSVVPANIIYRPHFGASVHQNGGNAQNVKVQFSIDNIDNETIWSDTSMQTLSSLDAEDEDYVFFADSTGFWNTSFPNAYEFYNPSEIESVDLLNYLNGIPYDFKFNVESENEDGDLTNNSITIPFLQTYGRYSYHWQTCLVANVEGDIGPFSNPTFQAEAGDVYANVFDFYQEDGDAFKIYGVRVFIPNSPRVTFDLSGKGVVISPVIYFYDETAADGEGDYIKIDIAGAPHAINNANVGNYLMLRFDIDDVEGYNFDQGKYLLGIEVNDYKDQKFAIGLDRTYPQANAHFFMNVGPENTWQSVISNGAVMIDVYTQSSQMESEWYCDPVGVDELEITSNVQIYPNPTKGNLNIKNAEQSSIYIYSITGILIQLIKNESTELSVNLSDLSNGTYLVKIVKENEVISKKFILNR